MSILQSNGIDGLVASNDSFAKHREKIIIDTDPGIGIFLHDPVSFVALVRPDLFTFKKGVVRVETQGLCVGHALMDQGLKKWNSSNPWSELSPVSVAWEVQVEKVIDYIFETLMKP